MDGGNSAVFFSHKITYFTCSCKVLIRKSKSASCTDMKLCGKLAAPRAPGNAEMSFQTGTQTAEGLQLPKTWVTWTLGQLEKGKEEGKGAGGEEDRGERRAVTRGWEWGRREAGLTEPWRSSSLGEENETSSYHTPCWTSGDKGGALPWTWGYDWWLTNPNHAWSGNHSGRHH